MSDTSIRHDADQRDEQGKQEEKEDERSVSDAKRLSSRLIYEVVRRDGFDELNRSAGALAWSGIAAGMMIAFSVLAEAFLRSHLPIAPWVHLVESIGYSFGFLLVIIGRMQLFTENTISTVLPVAGSPSLGNFFKVVRLWTIVLAANVAGAFLAAAFIAFSPAFSAEITAAVHEISHEATGNPPLEGFFRAIPAGILVAAIVWMLPTSGPSRVFIIILFTWLIAAGDFTHIIAGSVEMAYMLLTGVQSPREAVGDFFLPVLAGNIIGGTTVFTMMAWGQVRNEVDHPDSSTSAEHSAQRWR